MNPWIRAIMAILNLGGCWQGQNGAQHPRCTLY